MLSIIRRTRWIAAAAFVFGAVTLTTPREASAQDSCSGGNFEVMPCVLGEMHVSSGGTARFEMINYYYGDDYYYVTKSCSGVVQWCNGGGYYYVPSYTSGYVDIGFTLSAYGVGYVDATITSTWVRGDVSVEETVYGQEMLAIDSAQPSCPQRTNQ